MVNESDTASYEERVDGEIEELQRRLAELERRAETPEAPSNVVEAVPVREIEEAPHADKAQVARRLSGALGRQIEPDQIREAREYKDWTHVYLEGESWDWCLYPGNVAEGGQSGAEYFKNVKAIPAAEFLPLINPNLYNEQ